MDSSAIAYGTVVALAAIAAFTDFRRGIIPNWLTLPPLVIAPIVHAIQGGAWAGLASVAAAVLCGLVPYLLFKRGAAGGGDVKLLAAIGAVAGLSLGVEAQLATFMAAAVVSLGQLAWRGQLVRTLANTFYLALNPVLPRRMRREMAPELMTAVRLGSFVLAGTVIAVVLRHQMPWS